MVSTVCLKNVNRIYNNIPTSFKLFLLCYQDYTYKNKQAHTYLMSLQPLESFIVIEPGYFSVQSTDINLVLCCKVQLLKMVIQRAMTSQEACEGPQLQSPQQHGSESICSQCDIGSDSAVRSSKAEVGLEGILPTVIGNRCTF